MCERVRKGTKGLDNAIIKRGVDRCERVRKERGG